MVYRYCETPVGRLKIVEDNGYIVRLLNENEDLPSGAVEGENELLSQANKELLAYFSKELKDFTIPLNYNGTAFQNAVWRALTLIPYGFTSSYKGIGRMIGNEKASRAVGNAVGKNPLPIFIPCHRVLASDGTVGGFAWGTEAKKILLFVERD